MSLSGKLVFEQEISSPGILFFELYGSKKEHLPSICPDKLPSIELLEGNWGEAGCKFLVNYLIDGKLIPVKETIETVDEDNRSMTYRILEGDLLKDYKSLLITFQATSKGEKNFLNWTYEYEKQNLDVPAPDHLFDFVSEVSNIIDAYFLKNQDHFQAL